MPAQPLGSAWHAAHRQLCASPAARTGAHGTGAASAASSASIINATSSDWQRVNGLGGAAAGDRASKEGAAAGYSLALEEEDMQPGGHEDTLFDRTHRRFRPRDEPTFSLRCGGERRRCSSAAGASAGPSAWGIQAKVIELYPDGTAVECMRPRTARDLGLHPRDMGLFAPLSRLAAPQQATIAVREGRILFKTEVAKAIISADKVILIKGRRPANAMRMSRDLITACEFNEERGLPFELAVLEVLLDATAEYFYKKTQHLNWMMESIGDEIRQPRRPFTALDKAHQLIPIQKFLTAIKNDVRETGEAIKQVMEDDLPDLCLSFKHQVAQAQEQARLQREQLEAFLDTEGAGAGAVPKEAAASAGTTARSAPISAPAGARAPAHDLTVDPDEEEDLHHRQLHPLRLLRQLRLQERQLSGDAGAHHGGHLAAHRGSAGSRAAMARAPAPGGAAATLPPALAELKRNTEKRAEEMLESYEREIQSLEGSLRETEENLDNTRQIWHMQLDSSRNHIMLVNLWVSILSISAMVATIIPAFFGMNLDSGLPSDSPTHFVAVVAVSIALAVGSFPAARELYFRNWRRQAQQELFEQKMLRVLLVQHIDDLDDILAALSQLPPGQHIDRYTFRDVVSKALGPRAMSPANADFLYHIFDRNKDGFLTEAELMRRISLMPSPLVPTPASEADDALPGARGPDGAGASGTAAAIHTADNLWSRSIRRTPERRPNAGRAPTQGRAATTSWEEDEQLRWD